MNFIDEVSIYVKGGNGGDGCCAFRREKFMPRGGPSGGDGGHGGSVILQGDEGLSTLRDLRYQRHYRAERGRNGQGDDKHGRRGRDVIIRVPLGTVVKDYETGEVLGEVLTHGQELVVARGGAGGHGNLYYVTPQNQAPTRCDPGQPGEERRLRLELKVLADVGLLGLPNAGKSTLLSVVSAARPKVADYPFTTLIPTLGVVRLDHMRSFVMADIPGLVEGAHQGRGLGHRFLRHLERTRLLLHLIEYPLDPEADPVTDYESLSHELEAYDPRLARLPRLVVMTKIDLCDDRSRLDRWRGEFPNFVAISAVTREGIDELLEKTWQMLVKARHRNHRKKKASETMEN